MRKSLNWDIRSKIELAPGYFIPGAPFEEGLPNNNDDAWYELILHDGRRVSRARVDYKIEKKPKTGEDVKIRFWATPIDAGEPKGPFFEPIVAAWRQVT